METRQRRALTRHRAIASGLLLAMVLVLVASHWLPAASFWTRLLRAGAEAAIVGGLADWFAVTALFRQPLGLPIPHTAVIPRNKDRIGAGLGEFVQRHFLDPDLVAERLAGAGLGRRAGIWLADRGNADIVAEKLAALLPALLRSLDDAEIRGFFRGALSEQIAALDPAPLAGKALAALTREGRHDRLFAHALDTLRRLLTENRDRIVTTVEERSRWWIPRTIDRGIASAIIQGVDDLLAEMTDPGHPNRQSADRALARLIDDLQSDPAHDERLRRMMRELLADPAVQTYLGTTWDAVRALLVAEDGEPTARVREGLGRALAALGAALAADPAMQARVDGALTEAARGLVLPWRAEIGRFITEVVRGWEAETVASRIELAVGRDLQYIRINGTLVGALVGCLLFVLSQAPALF